MGWALVKPDGITKSGIVGITVDMAKSTDRKVIGVDSFRERTVAVYGTLAARDSQKGNQR